MPVFKYIPSTIGVFANGEFYPATPVIRVITSPPYTHSGSGIKDECTLVTIHTHLGERHYGVTKARIRMAVQLFPGCERDEVVAKWDDAPAW